MYGVALVPESCFAKINIASQNRAREKKAFVLQKLNSRSKSRVSKIEGQLQFTMYSGFGAHLAFTLAISATLRTFILSTSQHQHEPRRY